MSGGEKLVNLHCQLDWNLEPPRRSTFRCSQGGLAVVGRLAQNMGNITSHRMKGLKKTGCFLHSFMSRGFVVG